MRYKRFPKILADELNSALDGVSEIPQEQVTELLKRFRHNRVKWLAAWLQGCARVECIEPIPYQYQYAIKKLDEAFAKVHRYRNDGAGDYVSAGVVSKVARLNAKNKRKRATDYKVIAEHLLKRGYKDSDNKQSLVDSAAEHFGVSRSTVQRAIREHGLASKKQPSVT